MYRLINRLLQFQWIFFIIIKTKYLGNIMGKRYSENELVLLSKEQLFALAKYYLNHPNAFEGEFNDFPTWVHVNNAPTMFASKINRKFEEDANLPRDLLVKDPIGFYKERISVEDTVNIVSKLANFLSRNNKNEIIEFEQGVRLKKHADFTTHLTFSKILET